MSMDGAILPINFYCRNARLCLKKAALSKKSHLYDDELQHLKAFETLVLSTIPGHPLYSERKEEKPVLELRLHLQGARKRITEIEESDATKDIKNKTRQPSGNGEKELNFHNSRGLGDKTGDHHISAPTVAKEQQTPTQLEGKKFKSREETPLRAQRSAEGASTRSHQHQQRPSSAGRSTAVRAEGFQRTRTRSVDSTPLKKQRNEVPRIVSDFRASWAASQNKARKQQPQQHQRFNSLTKDVPEPSFDSPRMEDTYAFASKHQTRSKSTPILQRLRNVSECLGGESPRRGKGKTAVASAPKAATLSRENSPFRPKSQREMPRLKALGLVSSAIEGGKPTSTKATTDLPTQFDEDLSLRNNVGRSEDDPEGSNTLSSEEKPLSPDDPQVSSPQDEQEEEALHLGGTKDDLNPACFHRRMSAGRYPSNANSTGEKESSETASFGIDHSQNSFSAERENGERLGDDGSETMRREGAWTTFRLQEQFGEALKELGTLQDRDEGEGELEVRTPDKSVVRGATAYRLHNDQQQQQSLLQSGGGQGDRVEKMHGWKLGMHVKGQRLQEIEEEEAYFERALGGTGGYGEGTDESDRTARTSPIEPTRKKNAKHTTEADISESKLHYGESADHLDMFTPPHSKEGSDISGGCLIENLRDVKEDCLKFRKHMKALRGTRIREFPTPPKFHDHGTLGLLTSRDGTTRSKKRRPKEANLGRDSNDKEELLEDEIGDDSDVNGEQPGSWSYHQQVDSRGKGYSKKQNKAATNDSELNISPLSLSSASSSSSSSSSSSLSSLPLSQYIQKLKHLAPESRFGRFPGQGFCDNSSHMTASKRPPSSKYPPIRPPERVYHHPEPESSKTLDSTESGGQSDAHHGASAAILLPKSPPTSQVALSARIQQRLGHLTKGRKKGSDQRLDAVLGGCALVQSHLQRIQDSPEGRSDVKLRTTHNKGGGGGGHHHKSSNFFSARCDTGGGNGPIHDLVSYVSHKRDDSKQSDVFDGSMASIQRLVGELKGSVEGFKIRIEVESESWRGRVEGLEKEIETLKDETDDELMELKKTIRSDVKARMSELAADVERIRKDEKDQVANLVQEKIGSHLSSVTETAMGDLKKEIRSLWTEVESLTKGRKEMQTQMENLTQMSEESRESTSRELRNLKRDVQGADERNDWKRDSDAERTERAEVRHALEKIKDEGLDMKMEVNGLKKAEKMVKAETESIRKLVEKLQQNTEELERDREAAQMEGVRERLLIMERVESLSQLYLGGLEEVRTDVFNVKFSCRDRVDELETQWGEYKRHQENGSEDDNAGPQKLRHVNEMDLIRSEISDMMEIERSQLRETVEREQEALRRQMVDISNNNKSELSCMMKLEVQRRIQAAKDKVFSVADPMMKDMDRLKMDLHEAQQGAEAVADALAMVEKERDLAAQAAADATAAAEKAGEVLADLLGPISQELATTRRKCVALQDTISLDRDAATQALGEAKKMHQEFQDFMGQEMMRLKTAISLVHKERDSAATAASEASTSAVKAGEVLAEVLGSFNQEMSKARRKSYQLQEGLDRERESLERDREEVIQRSQDAQEKFNEELERAILTWKRAMNQEVAKAKAIVDGLDEERRRAAAGIDQYNSSHAAIDHAHVAKAQEALVTLKAAVKQIQDAMDMKQEEKQRRRAAKHDGRLWKEQEQKVELNAVKLRIDEALNREESLREVVNETGTRVQKLEILHVNLAQSFEEVRVTTGDLEKTAAIWLPKYENAARILSEINCKVENLEERCRDISVDEGLMQKMAHVAESKVQSLKDTATGGTDLNDLMKRVENEDEIQRQAMSLLETRVTELESSVGPEVRELSLRVNYISKKLDGDGDDPHQMIGLIQILESLERKVELFAAQSPPVEPNLDLPSKINGLESRIELVASATFTNLRLLDSKVEECTANVHEALEGAATAENKCSALGTELVKVFRMLASSRQASPPAPPRTRSPPSCGRDHSPTKTNPVEHSPSPPRTRSPLQRRPHVPKPNTKKFQQKLRTADFTRSTMASEMRKVTTRSELDPQEEYVVQESTSPTRDRITAREENAKALTVHRDESCNTAKSQEFMLDRSTSVQEGDIRGLGRLTISQDQADDKQRDETNKCQRTNIRLEAGRIHVNVSHRSGVSTGSRQKRADLVAVQT